jgi:two-component system chemotaxis response regulator CheB
MNRAMPGHDIIVIGASAGGVEALVELVAQLPPDLPAALFVVHHFPARGTSLLPQILSRRGPLPAQHPQNGEVIQPGRIYVAPPDHHLLIHQDYIRLARGPRENSHRPAVDPLFRTAARSYGRRVVGVILSGTLDDGTAGLLAVKQRGGVAIVQDPREALYDGMPRNALENVQVDHIVSVSDLAALLTDLAHQPVPHPGEKPMSDNMKIEADMAEMDPAAMQADERPGTPAPFSCPECGGTLWQFPEEELIRFRCRVGHAFSGDSLMAEQASALEAALWTALRALKESGALARRLAERSREHGRELTTARFEEQAHDADQHAAVIQQVLLKNNFASPLEAPPHSEQGMVANE